MIFFGISRRTPARHCFQTAGEIHFSLLLAKYSQPVSNPASRLRPPNPVG